MPCNLQGYEGEVPREHTRLATSLPPASAPLHGWLYDKAAASWAPWASAVPAPDIPADAQLGDIVVPTVVTVRYTFLLDTCVRAGHPVLLVGPTGTGKSLLAGQYLASAASGRVGARGVPDAVRAHERQRGA
jgi:P-loop containing dynein motor region